MVDTAANPPPRTFQLTAVTRPALACHPSQGELPGSGPARHGSVVRLASEPPDPGIHVDEAAARRFGQAINAGRARRASGSGAVTGQC